MTAFRKHLQTSKGLPNIYKIWGFSQTFAEFEGFCQIYARFGETISKTCKISSSFPKNSHFGGFSEKIPNLEAFAGYLQNLRIVPNSFWNVGPFFPKCVYICSFPKICQICRISTKFQGFFQKHPTFCGFLQTNPKCVFLRRSRVWLFLENLQNF